MRFTDSTNEDAWEFYADGCPEGTIIITDDQRKGKGRRGSDWSSSPTKGLTFSFLLKPNLKISQLGLLPLLTGVSVAKGINAFTLLEIGLKWPNDIMVGGMKTGGILIESKSTADGIIIVIGVGENINEEKFDFPEKLQASATSILMSGGKTTQREPLLAAIMNQFEELYQGGFETIPQLWQDYCIHLNESVTFHEGGNTYSGVFEGITESGQALIQIEGKTSIFSAGVVEL